MTPSNYRGSLSPSLFLVVVVVAIFLVVVVVTSRGNSTAIFRNIPSPDATRRDELLLSLRSHKATPWFHENAPTFVPSLSVSTLTHALRNKSASSRFSSSLSLLPSLSRSFYLSLSGRMCSGNVTVSGTCKKVDSPGELMGAPESTYISPSGHLLRL